MPDVVYDVFISYSSKDALWTRGDLLSRLEQGGLRVCIDYRDFTPGEPSRREMRRAVEQSRHTLLVLTPAYLASEWTEFEALLAGTLDPANRQRRIVPLRHQPCDPPLDIGYLTIANFVDPPDVEAEWQRLLKALGVPLGVQQLAALPEDRVPEVSPLPAGSRMPLSHNPLFTGRQNDLQTLARLLRAGETAAIGPIAAATGLGGIGKTQLASEFVHRYGRHFAGGVFWLSFADPAGVTAEIAACGGPDHLNLAPDFGALPLEQQVRLVQAQWQLPLQRLLVFDNCEDEALLEQWRPRHGGCRVLITSRRAAWLPTLGVQPLPLDVLLCVESVALLRRYLGTLAVSDADLASIAAAVGDLPLALHLSGSFLARYGHAVSLDAYLAELGKPDALTHRALEGWKLDQKLNPTRHEEHVARTFALSYEQLDAADETDALALRLLARAAHFAPGEPIPRDLLKLTLSLAEDDAAAALLAEDALRRLLDLGLLETEDDGALRLHRLLAIFVRAVATEEQAQAAVEQALLGIANRLNNAGDPRPLLVLQPHLRAITDAARERLDEHAASLCNTLAYHLYMIGDYIGARPYFERALAINEQVLGTQHPETARSLNNLGGLLRAMGDLAGAQPYVERALAIREQVLGAQHPDTARSLNNLGALLRARGDYAEAQLYYERALAICEQVLGSNHPNTRTVRHNLAALNAAIKSSASSDEDL